MSKTPIIYTNEQFEQLEDFVEQNFGSHYDYLVHEIKSDYVHTDVFVVKEKSGSKFYITCGMGAREMESPNNFTRSEVTLGASKNFVITSNKGCVLANELIRTSKFPFRNNTWLGNGHTLDASDEFKKAFGYDYFAFLKLPMSVNISDIDEPINFLTLVPIYESEREWCVNNHTIAFLEQLHGKYGNKIFEADFKRPELVPCDLGDEEKDEYNIMTALNINKETLQKLFDYMKTEEEKGNELSFDMIIEWVEKNK